MTRFVGALLFAMLSLPAYAGPAYTEWSATAGAVGITGTSPAWHYQEIRWQRREDDGLTYYVAGQHEQRFELADNQLSGGLYVPVSRHWAFDGRLELSHDPHFLPRDSEFGGVDYTVQPGWIVHAGLKHSRYQDLESNVASLGAEAYIGAWRFAYTLFDGATLGASGASHVLEADWYYGNLSFLGLVLVRGRQVDRVSPTHLVVTRVDGFTFKGKQVISSHWAVTYTLGLTSLKAFYTRRGVSVGLAYRY